MEILIDNRQKIYPISENKIRKKTETILDALECPDAELSIVVVDDAQMARLNREYLGRSGPTNVIAFSMQEGAFKDINPALLGDVVVSVETADKESKIGGMRLEDRFAELLIHGILHLIGFDHEKRAEDAETMEARETELKRLLQPGLSRL
ncbi:MAG: rRNA maturation RNase YbeY [Proteobacteria bacterium]|nr:rRNA maturation RNase YbeY [Pseudomonadota bacterium]